MAAEQNIVEERNITDAQNITETEKINEEEDNTLELTYGADESLSGPDPPDQPAISQDDSQADTGKEQNWPMHERCVHGEINDIWVPLDKSEVYFRPADDYELPPFSKYHFREWSEVEHLFMPAIEFAEELYGDWSPCPSPSSTSMGL